MSKFKALFEEAKQQDQSTDENKEKKKVSSRGEKASSIAASTAPIKSSRVKGRRSDPSYIGAFAYIPAKLHEEVKIKLFIRKDLDFSGLVENLLSQWLAEQK
jgi:hypothetical protein